MRASPTESQGMTKPENRETRNELWRLDSRRTIVMVQEVYQRRSRASGDHKCGRYVNGSLQSSRTEFAIPLALEFVAWLGGHGVNAVSPRNLISVFRLCLERHEPEADELHTMIDDLWYKNGVF